MKAAVPRGRRTRRSSRIAAAPPAYPSTPARTYDRPLASSFDPSIDDVPPGRVGARVVADLGMG